jgi:hypothetical protein
MSGRLAEVPEAEADGEVASLYDDIRRVAGVSTVPLVYRALAVEPAVLEAIWTDLAPNLADAEVRERAAALGHSGPRPADPTPVALPLDREQVATTLAIFDRVNTLNAVGLTALLGGVDGLVYAERPAGAADPLAGGLPMADLTRLGDETLALLERMSRPVTGGGDPVVVPSLYRYFAHEHASLEMLWDALQPVVEGRTFAPAAAGVRADAGAIATSLPYRIRRLDSEPARSIVERFLVTIPAMIVVTALIRSALRPSGQPVPPE